MPSHRPGTPIPLIGLTLALVALLAAAALAMQPHTRDGWHVGVSYGMAAGEFDGPGGGRLDFEDGVSPHLRAARMLGPRLALGLAYAGWMYETGDLPLKQRYSMQNLLASVAWYPGRAGTASDGLCLRVGLGLGWIGYTEVEIVDLEEQGHGHRVGASGPALELNLSYEFRLSQTVAAGLGLGVNSIGLDTEVESATFVPLTVNLGWYWD